jgi:hypothetical protein
MNGYRAKSGEEVCTFGDTMRINPRLPYDLPVHRPRWTALVALTALAALTLAPLGFPASSRAQVGPDQPGQPVDLLAPLEQVLSTGTWLVAAGLDPRFSDAPVGFTWGVAGAPAESGALPSAATPVAGSGSNQLVTRQVGLTPISASPHLAVDPLDPDHLVLGVMDLNLPSVATYTTFDGGETWQGPNQAAYFPGDLGAAGGPVVAFDRQGTVFLASLSIGTERHSVGGVDREGLFSRVVVSRSDDGGLSWGDPVSVTRSTIDVSAVPDETGRDRGEITAGFLDRPWLAIGPDPRNPARDVLFMTFTELLSRHDINYADEIPLLTSTVMDSTIQFARSSDGGRTWSNATNLSAASEQESGGAPAAEIAAIAASHGDLTDNIQPRAASGVSGATTRMVQGAQPVVTPDGVLAVAFLDLTADGPHRGLATIKVTLSKDAGRTFSEPIRAAAVREIAAQPRSAPFRWWDSAFPKLAAGTNGELYLTLTAQPANRPGDDGDVVFLRSLDMGESWAAPTRIDTETNPGLQFIPAIAVGPNGSVHAAWADTSNDLQGVHYTVVHSESVDQGATWSTGGSGEEVVSDRPSNALTGFPGGRFLGGQIALAAAGDSVAFAWPDTRLSDTSHPNLQVGFSRLPSSGERN